MKSWGGKGSDGTPEEDIQQAPQRAVCAMNMNLTDGQEFKDADGQESTFWEKECGRQAWQGELCPVRNVVWS